MKVCFYATSAIAAIFDAFAIAYVTGNTWSANPLGFALICAGFLVAWACAILWIEQALGAWFAALKRAVIAKIRKVFN